MGPHFFKCGNVSQPTRQELEEESFNGAALFQVRKWLDRKLETESGGSFNGAALFQVRKCCATTLVAAHLAGSFNGAALFQVRKLQLMQNRNLSERVASMGPHFFKCGNALTNGANFGEVQSFNGAALFQVRKCVRSFD